jgi:hypothetical protein
MMDNLLAIGHILLAMTDLKKTAEYRSLQDLANSLLAARSPAVATKFAARIWDALPAERRAEIGTAAVLQALVQIGLQQGRGHDRQLQRHYSAANLVIEDIALRLLVGTEAASRDTAPHR